jgi:hypothetical protein
MPKPKRRSAIQPGEFLVAKGARGTKAWVTEKKTG